MRILFLGGTSFVGRHLVEAALAHGHSVSIFHRGRTNPGLFPQAEELTGDRDGQLEALHGRSWDAAVDVSGYVPRIVRASAELLRDRVGQYLFISTGSVYNFQRLEPFGDEDSILETLSDGTTEEYNGPAYGGLKVLCEQIVRQIYPDRHLIQRLGVTAGPYDPTDRVTYWVERVARGGDVLVPGGPERRIQFIDARDMAAFGITSLEKQITGTYNTAGNSMFWSAFLDACWQAAGRPSIRFTWVNDDTLLQGDSQDEDNPAYHFPLMLPPNLDDVFTRSNDRALAEGLVFRSTLNTARDILAWVRTRPADTVWQAGVSAEDERQLLEAWHARQTQR
jgi:2'-hydroxyisoflavone reductase